MITKEQLAKFTGNLLADKYYQAIVDECAKGNITGKLRVCAFLAQILHESANLLYSKELTGHTVATMRSTWPHLFPTDASAQPYLHQPEKLFNYVYGTGKLGRDLGNDQPGDGWKYIGRGFIGTTGKANYKQLSDDTGIDFVNHPELLEQPHYALMSAVNFWNKYKLSELADKGDSSFVKKMQNGSKVTIFDKGSVIQITHRVNGGEIGLSNRQMNRQKLMEIYQ